MKLSHTNFVRLAVASLVVLTTGCRPTIEFESDFTSVAPGDEVEFEWDIELAKGTSSSKVTLSNVGEVELEGSESITINDSEEITLRVSTFVLGMPITSKETISINVLEDNYVTWDFDDSSNDGWDKGYAFYDSENGINGDGAIFCSPGDEYFDLDSFESGSVDPGISGLGSSLSFCFHNNEDYVDEDEDENEKAVMSYAYRKVTSSDGFELDDNTTYNVGFSVKYGINIDSSECDNISNDLDGVFQIVVGVSRDEPEEDLRKDNKIVSFKLEELEDSVNSDGLIAEEFTAQAGSSSVSFLRADPITFEKDDDLPVSTSEDYIKELCENNMPFEAVFNNVTENQLQHSTEDDAELYLIVGLKSGLLSDEDNEEGKKLVDDTVEFYIDTIKVLIEEAE